MILSNISIIDCIEKGLFSINPFNKINPSESPFNTSAIDLRLGNEILVPKKDTPVALDLREKGIANFIAKNSKRFAITEEQPYTLKTNEFILGNTLETVSFPLNNSENTCYSARIEGKSSIARCGILVHFTAPTIHAGFEGTITLEIVNMGAHKFLLYPGMFICQLIIEEVRGCPATAPNQFSGQHTPEGVVKK